MKNVKIASLVLALSAVFMSMSAKADMVTDAHGNVGYDTAAECDAAVANGSARFYQPFTHKPPLKRKGEARVQTATLKDLGEQFTRGACDVGVGRRLGREGVSTSLQGKFIPFSPDMPINVYTDKAGNAVRVTMAQCDNWFSGNAPRPVAVVATRPEPTPSEPIVDTTPAVVPAVAAAFAAKPYVFGTVGALHAGTKAAHDYGLGVVGATNDTDTRVAGQAGFGVQFNKWLGAELFYTGSDKHKFETTADISTLGISGANDIQNYTATTLQQTYGGRLTLGNNINDKFRVFAKAGAAGTTMKVTDLSGGQNLTALATVHKTAADKLENRRASFARATAGLGATYLLNDKLAVRGDYDHYFKKNYTYKDRKYTAKGSNYVGIGVQYNFR